MKAQEYFNFMKQPEMKKSMNNTPKNGHNKGLAEA